jgi:hypothetical protein
LNVIISASRLPFGHFSGLRSDIGTKSYSIAVSCNVISSALFPPQTLSSV